MSTDELFRLENSKAILIEELRVVNESIAEIKNKLPKCGYLNQANTCGAVLEHGHEFCTRHNNLKCVVCGEQAVNGCPEFSNCDCMCHCNAPLCKTCVHDDC